MGSIPSLGIAPLLKLGQFYSTQFVSVSSLQTSTNIVGKVPEMDYRSVQESQYNGTLNSLRELKHCLHTGRHMPSWLPNA